MTADPKNPLHLIPHEELDGMSFVEYEAFREQAFLSYGDGESIQMVEHPRPPFFKRIWLMIKAIFVRPKFSKEALEPAEKVISDDGILDNFGLPKDFKHGPIDIRPDSSKEKYYLMDYYKNNIIKHEYDDRT